MASKNKANHQTRLDWNRAHNLEKLEVDVKTIFVHERIPPEQIIQSMRELTERKEMPLLAQIWEDFNGVARDATWNFYQHANWSNRLIHGNSIEVMASLLDKEHETLAGKVQCIYFDPPYGIDFSGFKRPRSANRRGDETSGSVRAFVDSYIRVEPDGEVVTGLPAYLDGVYRACALGHRLLTDSGSMFVQISNVNVHRVALIMDEVFGETNRMRLIKYQTATTTEKTLSRSGDYILWYAKNRISAEDAFNPIYEPRSRQEFLEAAGANAIGRHRTTKQIRTWGQLKAKYGEVPNDWDLGKKNDLTSQHQGTALQGHSWPKCAVCPSGPDCKRNSKCMAPQYKEIPSRYRDKLPHVFKVRPKIDSPDPANQWRVNNPSGIDRLADQNRLCATVRTMDGAFDGVRNIRELAGDIDSDDSDTVTAEDGLLRWISFQSEDPGGRLSDNWGGGAVKAARKLFVVQTPEKFIERCILMTTRPGDLVLDPTCGSGTTAIVAERLGRRWITSDAGAWQIAIARERLATELFDNYLLRGTKKGKDEDKRLDDHVRARLVAENPVDSDEKGNDHIGLATENHVDLDEYDERDPAQGFVYDRRPDISAGNLSSTKPVPIILLVDRPVVAPGGKNRRVCSAFTVERLAPYEIIDSAQVIEPANVSETSKRVERRLDGLEFHGALLEDIRDASPLVDGSILTHRCTIDGKEAAMWIAQPSETVSEYQVNKVADEARAKGLENLVIAAFSYEDVARPQRPRDEGIKIWCLVLPVSLTISDAEAKKDNPPVLLAEPNLDVERTDDGRVSVIVNGFTTWNPVRAEAVGGGGASEIACILIDTNYDKLRFNAKRIQFPKPPKSIKLDQYRQALENQVEAYRKELDELLDKDAWKYVRSTRCIPFKPPENGAIAVRIITSDGDTMTRVLESAELEVLAGEETNQP